MISHRRIISNSQRLAALRRRYVLSHGTTTPSTSASSMIGQQNRSMCCVVSTSKLSTNTTKDSFAQRQATVTALQKHQQLQLPLVMNGMRNNSSVNTAYSRYFSSTTSTTDEEKNATEAIAEAEVVEKAEAEVVEKAEPIEAEVVNDSATADASSNASADTATEVTPSPPLPPKIPPGERLEFQAETRQLLDIVTNSLYTDKEVFLRELVSNASDSLEKLRHLQATNQVPPSLGADADLPLEIRIDMDEVTSSITIADTGIGMTKEDMISNLGVIARSGSKSFVQQMKQGTNDDGSINSSSTDTSAHGSIIGKFGVGFYSSFMVGQKVEVRSKSAMKPEESPKVWVSDGSGSYEISELPDEIRQDRGSSIVIYLKEDDWGFCNEKKLEEILKKYSNFVNFPIYLNGKLVNTVKALWAQDPKEISEEEYTDFYKYVANATDSPMETYHFRADAPIDIKALLFIPMKHKEKMGMERLEPGVSLYSRKILIEAKSDQILPDWLRFIKGVVDSEDLPLSISREKPQDTALVQKLRKTLTRKIVTHIAKMATKEKDRYMTEFYPEYSHFLKEGMCQDPDAQHQLSRLLRFETSRVQEKGVTDKEMVSFDEYISRMRPEQTDIYYLIAPSRSAALNSPYLEAFENASVEVLLMYTAIDEYVLQNMETYEGKKLTSADKGNIDFSRLSKTKEDGTETKKDDAADTIYKAHRELTKEEQLDFCAWFRKTLDKKVASISCTNRLITSPAIITDSQSGAMRRMMRMVDTGDGKRDSMPLPKQQVQINPKHPVIVGLFDIIETQPALAKVLAEQIFDNCLVGAGLLDDSRTMIPRINDILVCVVNGERERHGGSLPAGSSGSGDASIAADGAASTAAEAGSDAVKSAKGVIDDPFDDVDNDEKDEADNVMEAEFTESADDKEKTRDNSDDEKKTAA